MTSKLENFTDVLGDPDEICNSQPLSLSSVEEPGNDFFEKAAATSEMPGHFESQYSNLVRPVKRTGQYGEFRSIDEIDAKYRKVFSYPFFNLVQSRVIEDALYSDKSMVVCAPTGSGKTVVFEMAIVHLLMELEDRNENHDFKIIYMAPVKALCTERLTDWYSKFTKLGLLCIEVTGDTDVDFSHLKPYRIIITTPEKWDMLTRRWRDHRQLVEVIKLFLIDEVHILNDQTRGPVLEAVVSRMKTIETSVQSTHRIEQLQQQYRGINQLQTANASPSIRFVAVSATVSNPEDVAAWLGTADKPAVYYKFGDECRPVKLRRVVEGYPCAEGTSIFKFDLILNYKLWPIIQKYHNGKPTLIFCNTRKSVAMTAETLSREITISFNEEQRTRLTALASTIKNKKLQTLVLSGVGCHHAGLLYEERVNIERAFRNRDLPILITTTTLAMGVNLPAHLVIVKNTQQYVGGAYQEYSISTVLQMVGRAGRPQFDTEATAVIMTRMCDKARYQALVGGSEPLQSYLHKRLPENLNSEAALGTVSDVAQCVQWLRSTFLSVRAAKDPKRYLGLPQRAPNNQISKKIEELCVKAMNGLASSGLITMDEACCIESTEAGRLMSIFYLDLETMKHIMKIDGTETLERLLWTVCESHELSDMHLRIDERRCLNALNRNNAASTIRFPMKGKITTRQMKLNCVIQAILGCLPIPDPSLNQEATKIMRIADRVCKCLVAYVTRPALVCQQPKYYSAVLNSIILAKCIAANLWENSIFVSKQLKGIGPTFSTLLATAGKVNFMLLEESHPRDLERIMNKGPPAGNVLRKQISLLPKYQLTMTPIDEKAVSVQLVLLNHHNLSENTDNLTAGAAHKSYVVIGDSENVLLQLTSFSDKDLIGVYDGCITYQITRKHGFEHQIYAHCISSTFAGFDAECKYVFKDVEPQIYPDQSGTCDDLVRKPVKKQTTITDTFRERKRKNTDNEIIQSKEKKKRESALFEKFKNLKESFGKTSKVLKEGLDKSAVMSENILQELTYLKKSDTPSASHASVTTKQQLPVNSVFFEEPTAYEINNDDFINDDFMDEDKINDILNEIECEISTGSCKVDDKTKLSATNDSDTIIQKATSPNLVNTMRVPNRNSYSQIENYKVMNNRRRANKNISKKSNYNFIDLLEKNIDLSDAEESTVQEQNSFSDTIKSHIEKYLQKAKTSVKPPNRILDLIQDEPIPSKETEHTVIVQDSNVIDKHDEIDALGKTMQLTRGINNEKVTITNGDIEPTVNGDQKQVSVLEHKIKSIDHTIDQFPSIDLRNIPQIYEETELPAVELLHNVNKYGHTAIENIVEQTRSKNISRHNNSEQKISSNENEELETKPITETKETLNTENNKKTDLNNYEMCTLDFSVASNKIADMGRYNTSVVTPCPNLILKEKQEFPRIQPSNHARLKQDNEEVMSYNDPLPVSVQTAFKQINSDHKTLPIPLLSTSHVPETNDKQDFPMIELCKNYITELSPLEPKVNNKELTENNNRTTNDLNNQKASNEQNDNIKTQPVGLPNSISWCPNLKEKQDLTDMVLQKNEEIGFITPYKHPMTMVNIRKPLCLQNYSQIKLPITLQRVKTSEQPNLLEIKPPKSNNKEKREITTFSLAGCAFSSQPTVTQQNNSNKLPALLNTVSSGPELREKPDFQTIEYPKYNTENSDITTYNNPITSAIKNYPAFTQLNCNNDNMSFNLLSTVNLITKLNEKQENPKIDSPKKYNKVETYDNPTTCNTGNQPTATQQDHDYSYTNNQNHYVNKYSFSSRKTGESTQETADHVVRVIRELRIDLDITEIVFKDKKNMVDTVNIEDQIDNDEENPSIPFKKQKLSSNEHSATMVSNYNSGFCNPKALPICDGLTEEQKSSGSQIQPLPAYKPNTQLLSSDTKRIEVIQRDLYCEEVDKDNEENRNTFSEYKIRDSPAESNTNNVKSILQKYSNIMRNTTRNADLNSTLTKASEKTSSAAKKYKPKRPFKISDINRLNPIQLPSVLIEKPRAVNVTECFNLLEPNNKHAQLKQNKQFSICESTISTPKEPMDEQEYSEDEHELVENTSVIEKLDDILNRNPSYIDGFEVKEPVSNIDQTMFNPKTLLRCFISEVESEDIVPPPPEFSDNVNTTLESNTDVTLHTDCYDPKRWEEENDASCEGIHNRSIFQDNCQFELTPSKEIETWNLSNDEDSCQTYASPGSSPYSFTIMRKNKEQANKSNLPQHVSHPRHSKLEKFKFNHKNKFKL